MQLSYVICHGLQLVGPLEQNESFLLPDFDLLFKMEQTSHVSDILKVVDGMVIEGLDPDEDTSEFRSDLVMKLVSLLYSQPAKHRVSLPALKQEYRYLMHPPSPSPSPSSFTLPLIPYLHPHPHSSPSFLTLIPHPHSSPSPSFLTSPSSSSFTPHPTCRS